MSHDYQLILLHPLLQVSILYLCCQLQLPQGTTWGSCVPCPSSSTSLQEGTQFICHKLHLPRPHFSHAWDLRLITTQLCLPLSPTWGSHVLCLLTSPFFPCRETRLMLLSPSIAVVYLKIRCHMLSCQLLIPRLKPENSTFTKTTFTTWEVLDTNSRLLSTSWRKLLALQKTCSWALPGPS